MSLSGVAVAFQKETAINHLKNLTLTIAPSQTEKNPKLLRRQRLIDRLEEQRKLAADPTFTVLVRRWIKDAQGVKQPFDRQKRVKPWWRKDGNGSLVLVLKNGLKTIELEKGKPAVLVGTAERVEGILGTLIAAAKAGELDGALEAASDKPRAAKAASRQVA